MQGEDDSIGERIRYLREEVLDLGQEEFAREIGVSRGAVGNWELGKGIKRANVVRIADRCGISIEWLATNRGARPEPMAGAKSRVNPNEPFPLRYVSIRLKVAGAVEAGDYKMPGDESGREDRSFEVPLPENYRGTRPYLLRVKGESMNLVFDEGALLVCVHVAELGEEPKEGEFYIVRKTKPDGRIESTVKEYRRDADGRQWAWPCSTDPRWQSPYRLDDGDDGDTIELHAKVVFVLGRPARRRP